MLMNLSPPLKELVPVTPRGEATRRKLLASAEIEFGNKGFAAASVSSITQRADVGQGTFYLYFHSKEEVFATLVRDFGADQCRQLAVADAAAKDDERRLVTRLAEFVALQPGRHRILSEAQFVDEPAFREVQQKLLSTVASELVGGGRVIRGGEISLRAAALVGAATGAALAHCQWGGKPVSRTLVEAVMGSALAG